MAKIPVHIITGFLGSGKTTFLQELLKDKKNANIAVVVNELGEIALDHTLIESEFIKEKTLLLSSGCMCCHKREDLSFKFKDLLNRYESKNQPLERILVETTGLANPAPIIFTFLSDAFLNNHFEIANIISCIDAQNGLSHLENEQAHHQITTSDCILITKSDLKPEFSELENKIRSFCGDIKLVKKEEFKFENLSSIKHQKSEFFPTKNAHNSDINSLCFYFEEAIDWGVFGIWLSMLLHHYGDKILRVKGLLDIGSDTLVNINGVGHLIYPPTHIKNLDKEERSKLVFIAKNLDLSELERSLSAFLALSGKSVKFSIA